METVYHDRRKTVLEKIIINLQRQLQSYDNQIKPSLNGGKKLAVTTIPHP